MTITTILRAVPTARQERPGVRLLNSLTRTRNLLRRLDRSASASPSTTVRVHPPRLASSRTSGRGLTIPLIETRHRPGCLRVAGRTHGKGTRPVVRSRPPVRSSLRQRLRRRRVDRAPAHRLKRVDYVKERPVVAVAVPMPTVEQRALAGRPAVGQVQRDSGRVRVGARPCVGRGVRRRGCGERPLRRSDRGVDVRQTRPASAHPVGRLRCGG
jgi:hypothetical protein